MESVHKTASRPWISDLISVRQFRDDWCASLSPSLSNTRDHFKMNAKEISVLDEECGLASMKCLSQGNVEIDKNFDIPENVDLETLRLQKADVEKRAKDTSYANYTYHISKFCNYPSHKDIVSLGADAPADDTCAQVKQPEVVLFVQIFRPEKKTDCYVRSSAGRLPIFNIDQEFIVLGNQYLTELRDKIECVSDKAVPGDFSEHPDLIPEDICKEIFKSGFFYINEVFYNDMRHSDCRDYSQVIIDWSKNPTRGIGPFRKASMENTKFVDLEMKLGYPYVYVHQGNCEHLIVFSDLQLFTHHHNNNRNNYPARFNIRAKKRMLCMVCHLHTAEWITFDNIRVPENPFYFCKVCFTSYNYDEKGSKIGNFRAYHNFDRSNIL